MGKPHGSQKKAAVARPPARGRTGVGASKALSSNWKAMLKASQPATTTTAPGPAATQGAGASSSAAVAAAAAPNTSATARKVHAKELRILERVLAKSKQPASSAWIEEEKDTPHDRAEQLAEKNAADEEPAPPLAVAAAEITKEIALDGELISVAPQIDAIAKVSVVNSSGQMLYETFVACQDTVVDYRTATTGVRPDDLKRAPSLKSVQERVVQLLKDRLLVGCGLRPILKALFLSHPQKHTRDVRMYKPIVDKAKSQASSGQFSLQQAAQACLGENFSGRSALTSLDRAHLAMRLYKAHRKAWEKSLHYRPPKPAS